MTLKIAIELDNAAFVPDCGPEVARILRQLATMADRELITRTRGLVTVVRDVNGNSCGKVEVR